MQAPATAAPVKPTVPAAHDTSQAPAGAPQEDTQPVVETSPEDEPADDSGDEDDAPQVDPNLIVSDPIDWFLHRLYSRRYFRSGEEFTPGPNAGDEQPAYQPTHKTLRHFQIRSLFKLFATNLQKHEDVSGSQGQGVLQRLLGAFFGWRHQDYSVTKALVTITSVEVRQGSSWRTVRDFGAGKVFDFVALHEGGILELGEFPIDPGSYTRMRLNLADSNRVVVDEGHGEVDRPLIIPFYSTRKIELVRPFEVTDAGLTSVRIDFDLEQSINRFFNAYYLTPVMRIVGIETGTPSSAMISAAAGGVVEIMGEIAIVIPPGALVEDTQVTVRPTSHLLPHAAPDLLILGQEYEIEPAGLELNIPAQVVLSFNNAHAQALGVAPASLDLYTRPAEVDGQPRLWQASGGTAADGKIQATLATFGGIVLGGQAVEPDMSDGGGCTPYSDHVAVTPSALGIDPQVFYGECRRQQDCYQHGGKTYGRNVSQCLDEMYTGMTARCERLCQAGFGQDCNVLSEADRATSLYTTLVGGLYDSCLVVAGRIYLERDQSKALDYPSMALQTCEDYAGLGVSCDAPVCTLEVDQTAIPIDAPTDLNFTLSYSGSIHQAVFDGGVVFQGPALALPVEDTVEIVEEGRSLSAAKTFTATLLGPADQIGQCSVTVDVIEEPDPCTIVITPETTGAGQQVNLFVTVLPGYNTAFMDIRTEGVMNAIGLSAPDAAGTRYFSSNTRPTGTRSYTARVVHDDGGDFTCSASVTIQ